MVTIIIISFLNLNLLVYDSKMRFQHVIRIAVFGTIQILIYKQNIQLEIAVQQVIFKLFIVITHYLTFGRYSVSEKTSYFRKPSYFKNKINTFIKAQALYVNSVVFKPLYFAFPPKKRVWF